MKSIQNSFKQPERNLKPLRDTYKHIICISIFSILRTSLSVFADTPQKVSPGDWSCTRLIVSQHYTDVQRGRKDRGKPLLLYCNLHVPRSQKKQFHPFTLTPLKVILWHVRKKIYMQLPIDHFSSVQSCSEEGMFDIFFPTDTCFLT